MYHPEDMRAIADERANGMRRAAQRRGLRRRGRRRGLRGLFALHV